jgi:hypothetical protein
MGNKFRRLQLKYGRYAPENIMKYIVGAMGLIFITDFLLANTVGFSFESLFMFSREAVLQGQVWRVITFIFLPPNSSVIFMLFALYFYYFIGDTLEREWGSFWFDTYYLCGIIGTIIAGFISGYATNYYLNMSLFFAFAVMHPNFELRIFFIIPVKIKWLAAIDALMFIISFIFGTWSERAAIIAALANFFIFFGPSFFSGIRESIQVRRRRARFNSQYNDRNRWN